jgi:shikimate dehydrogenase
MTSPVRLGLIGDNIARSRSPALHRIAGRLNGLDVSYDLYIPRDMGLDFDAVFERCRAEGLRGVNVTYPYKEQAAALVSVADAGTRRIGAVNTVVFEDGGALGQNTDFTGFMAAYRGKRGDDPPGRVAIVGAGGVGKAVAFGLLSLDVETIAIHDRDAAKAAAMADALEAAGVSVELFDAVEDAVVGAQGIVNCTPVGMVGYPGTPVPAPLLAGAQWAFDAVYTPVDTTFKLDAEAAGLAVISGYELFFNQGIHAFEIFTGRAPSDLSTLRRNLADGHDT